MIGAVIAAVVVFYVLGRRVRRRERVDRWAKMAGIQRMPGESCGSLTRRVADRFTISPGPGRWPR